LIKLSQSNKDYYAKYDSASAALKLRRTTTQKTHKHTQAKIHEYYDENEIEYISFIYNPQQKVQTVWKN